jgi:hypothetical protein
MDLECRVERLGINRIVLRHDNVHVCMDGRERDELHVLCD